MINSKDKLVLVLRVSLRVDMVYYKKKVDMVNRVRILKATLKGIIEGGKLLKIALRSECPKNM